MVYGGMVLLSHGFVWSTSAPTRLGVIGRSLAYTAAVLLAGCLLPILAKWILVGRFTPCEIRLWSVRYFRFWLVRTLLALNPMVLFVGTPIYSLYLRALGARVGRGTTILSATVPVATDLITIGRDTVVRRGCSFSGYHAENGKLRTGRVTIGNDAFVGEATVLDIDTEIGDGAQLGHSSSLQPGQRVPPGERWHGVPAEPTGTNYKVVAAGPRGPLRRFGYSVVQLLLVLAGGTVVSGAGGILLTDFPAVSEFFDPGRFPLTSLHFYAGVAAVSGTLFGARVLLGFAVMTAVPRLLQLAVRPGRTYRLYGARHFAATLIMGLSNSAFFVRLFGDSSAAVSFTRAIGYRLPGVVQTGSNFGTELRQDAALFTTVSGGTMISDGVSINNADYSSSSFRMSPITIGKQTFMGNNIALPAGARIGDNVLLGTSGAGPTKTIPAAAQALASAGFSDRKP